MKKIYITICTILFLFTQLIGSSVSEKYGDRIELLGIAFKDPLVLCQILIAIFIAIVFVQSGIDKILDRKGNLEFFEVHFSKTPLKLAISLLLTMLTILELFSGILLIYGIYFSFVEKTTLWIFYGFVISAVTFIFLFLGQRIAKDYLGAADLVPYFILIMLGIMSMY